MNRTDILKEIICVKHREIHDAKERISLKEMMELAGERNERRSFYNALSAPGVHGVNIIAEIKRASPSKGMIREDLNIRNYAEAYTKGGAAAISVLTEEHFFKGSPEFIQQVREASPLPILRKDFIISPYQLYESVVIGADAVLLIAAVLSGEELNDFLELCKTLKLDALVEIHTEEEMRKAQAAGANLMGINNRNLKTFEVNIETSVRLVKSFKGGTVPVAESGIRNRQDIEKLLQSGIWNFLIGESLVRSDSPEELLRELMGMEAEAEAEADSR